MSVETFSENFKTLLKRTYDITENLIVFFLQL